jgi:DNA-directed RNA polymerase subunit RPC12/RpoP
VINPGYTAIVKACDFDVDAGPYIYCPKCKKPIMEAVVDKLKTRCKHCGKWIYLERKKS